MKGYMLDKFTFILNKSRYYNTSIDTTNAATTYLYYWAISINNTNIRIKGIPINNQLPEIDLNHYYI